MIYQKRIILIILIIVALLGIVGFLGWQYWKTPLPQSFQVEIQQSPEDVSDWKIYRNKEFGFEVKYPNDWKECEVRKYSFGEFVEVKPLLKIIPPITSSQTPHGMTKETLIEYKYNCMYGSLEIRILTGPFLNLKDVKNYYLNLFKQVDEMRCNPNQLIQSTTFHGYSALKIGSCDPTGEYAGTSIFFFHNNHLFEILYAEIIEIHHKDTLDKILSTFKFLE